jgi:hypothetical protein
MHVYEVTLEVRTEKPLNEQQQGLLRSDILSALDEADLPFAADVVTGAILPA